MTDWSGPTPFPSLITSCLPSTRSEGSFRAGRSRIAFQTRSPSAAHRARSAALREAAADSGMGSRPGKGSSPPTLPRWRRRRLGRGEGEGLRACTGSELSSRLGSDSFRVSIARARCGRRRRPHACPALNTTRRKKK